nr:hypothetical protein [Actinomycetota bacterium]
GWVRAQRAVGVADTTDFFELRAWSRLWLAETLVVAGRSADASETAASILLIHEAKGDVTGAARTRERLVELGIEHG